MFFSDFFVAHNVLTFLSPTIFGLFDGSRKIFFEFLATQKVFSDFFGGSQKQFSDYPVDHFSTGLIWLTPSCPSAFSLEGLRTNLLATRRR
jgi:hypothetical protein